MHHLNSTLETDTKLLSKPNSKVVEPIDVSMVKLRTNVEDTKWVHSEDGQR